MITMTANTEEMMIAVSRKVNGIIFRGLAECDESHNKANDEG